MLGFVVISTTSNCTMCFMGCATCNPRDITKCLSCVDGDYLTANQTCAQCPV